MMRKYVKICKALCVEVYVFVYLVSFKTAWRRKIAGWGGHDLCAVTMPVPDFNFVR